MDPVALASGGGWAVVVAMMIAIAWAFVKGHLIPGGVYRREVKRSEQLAEDIPELTAAVAALTHALEVANRDRYSA